MKSNIFKRPKNNTKTNRKMFVFLLMFNFVLFCRFLTWAGLVCWCLLFRLMPFNISFAHKNFIGRTPAAQPKLNFKYLNSAMCGVST